VCGGEPCRNYKASGGKQAGVKYKTTFESIICLISPALIGIEVCSFSVDMPGAGLNKNKLESIAWVKREIRQKRNSSSIWIKVVIALSKSGRSE